MSDMEIDDVIVGVEKLKIVKKSVKSAKYATNEDPPKKKVPLKKVQASNTEEPSKKAPIKKSTKPSPKSPPKTKKEPSKISSKKTIPKSKKITPSKIPPSDSDDDSITTEAIEVEDIGTTTLDGRVKQEYFGEDAQLINIERQVILLNIESLCISKDNKMYDNQLKVGKEISKNFKDRKVITQMILSKTQSGKTNISVAAIKSIMENNAMPAKNVFVITGLSSIEWKVQTKQRMPLMIRDNVFHLNDLLSKFVKKLKGLQNVLIIIDEIHVGRKFKQTIYNAFKAIGLFSLDYLYRNDIKILEFTATPISLIYDINKWGNHHKKVFVTPGVGYMGIEQLLADGKIRQYKKITGVFKTTKSISEFKENIKELKTHIDAFETPRYHIIRCATGAVAEKATKTNFKKEFKEPDYIIKSFNEKDKEVEDINDMLYVKPEQHTIIFIKELLRCAKTIYKKYIGILYDRPSDKNNVDVIIQGLAGRLTGYDYNGDALLFTDIKSIKEYIKRYNEKFVLTNAKSDNKYKKSTFNDADKIIGMKAIKEDKSSEDDDSIIHKIFNTEEELFQFHKTNIKTLYRTGTVMIKKKVPTSAGFIYERTPSRGIKTVDEVIAFGTTSLLTGEQIKYCRYLVGYDDVTDNTTAQYVLVYKKD
jgi:hypothetical protein